MKKIGKVGFGLVVCWLAWNQIADEANAKFAQASQALAQVHAPNVSEMGWVQEIMAKFEELGLNPLVALGAVIVLLIGVKYMPREQLVSLGAVFYRALKTRGNNMLKLGLVHRRKVLIAAATLAVAVAGYFGYTQYPEETQTTLNNIFGWNFGSTIMIGLCGAGLPILMAQAVKKVRNLAATSQSSEPALLLVEEGQKPKVVEDPVLQRAKLAQERRAFTEELRKVELDLNPARADRERLTTTLAHKKSALDLAMQQHASVSGYHNNAKALEERLLREQKQLRDGIWRIDNELACL